MKKMLIAATLLVAASSLYGACAWMQNARKSPKWFTDGVMYQIQPRAFTPEGTLKAAAKKLPYLKELGVTIAYLVPVMKMDTSSAPGSVSAFARRGEGRRFSLGPWGRWIGRVTP